MAGLLQAFNSKRVAEEREAAGGIVAPVNLATDAARMAALISEVLNPATKRKRRRLVWGELRTLASRLLIPALDQGARTGPRLSPRNRPNKTESRKRRERPEDDLATLVAQVEHLAHRLQSGESMPAADTSELERIRGQLANAAREMSSPARAEEVTERAAQMEPGMEGNDGPIRDAGWFWSVAAIPGTRLESQRRTGKIRSHECEKPHGRWKYSVKAVMRENQDDASIIAEAIAAEGPQSARTR